MRCAWQQIQTLYYLIEIYSFHLYIICFQTLNCFVYWKMTPGCVMKSTQRLRSQIVTWTKPLLNAKGHQFKFRQFKTNPQVILGSFVVKCIGFWDDVTGVDIRYIIKYSGTDTWLIIVTHKSCFSLVSETMLALFTFVVRFDSEKLWIY